jgi:hypothetical protein
LGWRSRRGRRQALELATLLDPCNNVDMFAYTVNVVNTRTGERFSVDPEIRNGGAGVC